MSNNTKSSDASGLLGLIAGQQDMGRFRELLWDCLLYTSDAADE